MKLHCDICDQEVGHYLHNNPRIAWKEFKKGSSCPDIICCLCFGNEERVKYYRENLPHHLNNQSPQ